MIRPLLRVSTDMICLPLPALIMARSHFEESVVDFSARRRSSVHSDALMKVSITAAKLFLKAGMGGVVVAKSICRTFALGAGPRRKSSGIGAIVTFLPSSFFAT